MTNHEAIETLKANYPDACYEQLREAVNAAIEALKAQDAAGDTISRRAAIGTVKHMREVCDTDDINDYYNLMLEAFNVLPPAQPERKTGKWIYHGSFDCGHNNCDPCIECSCCGTWFGADCYAETSYCPNCGSDNREEGDHS